MQIISQANGQTGKARLTRFDNLSILIIDDDDFTRSFYVSLIRKMGFGTVRDTASALNALDILAVTPFDLVLCDYEMPHVNGLSFVKLLRNGQTLREVRGINQMNSRTPVIMLTKHATRDVIKSTRNAGASGFLVKPVSPKALLQHIETLLAQA